MKKIIIVPYIKDDYVYFFNIRSQISKLNLLQNSIVYHIFRDNRVYKQFISNNVSSFLSENESIIYCDDTKNLYAIINDHLSEIDRTIVFQPSTVLKKDVSNIIIEGEYEIIGLKNNNLIKIYNKTRIIDLLRQKITVNEFVSRNEIEQKIFVCNDVLDAKKIMIQTDYDSKSEIPIQKTENNTECYYEDHLCMFAKFLGSNNILSSYVYFNKNNNKIYSIYNNLLGNIINYTGNIIKVEWSVNNEKSIKINYEKQSNNIFKPI